MLDFSEVKRVDPELFDSMEKELIRQRGNIELIASENIVSEAVMQAMGSHLTNKYAEGYPAKRYYGGCEFVDISENLARERAKQLFGAEHANVQPHSGAQANTAVYFAMLEPGDTILGMSLAHGGHLTHGSPVNISGKYFRVVPYGVSNTTETIDYDALEELALREKPKMIVAGASAYPKRWILNGLLRSPKKSARTSWWIWRILPAWWRQGCIKTRFPMRILSLPRRTRRCAGREAA